MTEVRLRPVEDADLDVLFDNEQDPEAAEMAGFPSRDRERFDAHWARLRVDDSLVTRAIVVDGEVAGNIGCWPDGDRRLVGYWVGREWWGRGVATRALRLMLEEVTTRPIHAYVARHNAASIRVLERCGFRVDAEGTVMAIADGIDEQVLVLDS